MDKQRTENAHALSKPVRIYHCYKNLMIGYIAGIVYSYEWIEDALQDTMLRVVRSAHKFDEDITSPRSMNLAITMAKCAAKNLNRAHNRQSGLYLADEQWHEIADAGVNIAEIVENDEMFEILVYEIGNLPDHYRIPMDLKYVHDFGNKEIAEELGITPGHVAVRLFRGNERLAKQLRRRGDIPWTKAE